MLMNDITNDDQHLLMIINAYYARPLAGPPGRRLAADHRTPPASHRPPPAAMPITMTDWKATVSQPPISDCRIHLLAKPSTKPLQKAV